MFIMSRSSHIALASYHSDDSTVDDYSNSYVGISSKFKKI